MDAFLMRHHLCFALAAIAFCLPLDAKAQGASPAPSSITCETPIKKDATHAQLEQLFGKTNVTTEEVDGAEGEKSKVTVVFAKDPARRFQISWNDEAKRARPAGISTSSSSTWSGPLGLRSGMSMEEVARINGQPITINGFQWDYGGYAVDLKGKLAQLPGGCSVMLRFSPEAELPSSAKYKPLIGDKKIRSDNALLLSVKPKLSDWSLNFDD